MKKILSSLLLFTFLSVSSSSYAICWFWQDCNKYKTKYPIVLVHGVSGFDNLLGMDYFYGVEGALEERGATVYAANVAAWNDPSHRGEALITQVEDVLAITGKDKVNLIGHSLGAPTIRYVAGVRPDLVASVTTVSGTNFGSSFADWGLETFPEGSAGYGVVEAGLTALGAVTDFLSGSPDDAQDAEDAVLSMTTAGSLAFNAQFPDGAPTSACGEGPELVNGIRYFSWGGDTVVTNLLDPSDTAFALTSLAFDEPNDGLVASCSMRWGNVLRVDYNMNHLDTVNLLIGFDGLFEVDPKTLYKNHAVRLKNLGL